MNPALPQSIQTLRTPRPATRTRRRERIDPAASAILLGMLGVFMLTTFRNPLQGEVIDNARWIALAGAFGYLALSARRLPAASGMPALLFLFVSLLSSLRSEYRGLCLAKLAPAGMSLVLFYYLIPASFARITLAGTLTRFAWGMNILAAMSFAYGLASGSFFSIGRYQSLFGGPNSEGIWAATASLSALWLWGRPDSNRWRNPLLASALLNATVVYATGSRSSFFGIIAGGAVWGMTQVLRNPSRRSRIILTTLLAALALGSIGREFYMARWRMMMRSYGSETFLSSRMNRWESSIESYRRSPRLGHGFGVSEMERNQSWEVGPRATATVRDGAGYLALLESVGWIGVTAFMLIVAQAALVQWRLLRRQPRGIEAFYSQSAFAVAVFLLVNLIGEPWILGPGSPTFHVFWFHLAGSVTFGTWALRNAAPKRTLSPLTRKYR